MLHALGLGDGANLGLFMVAVLVLNATPGVDLLLTIGRTLQSGWRAGMATALGINAGCVVHTLAAAFGLAALLAVSATAFTVLKVVGAFWLLWMAFGMARQAWGAGAAARAAAPSAAMRADSPDAAQPGARKAATPVALDGHRSNGSDFRTGFLTNVLNPKVALFFLAFLPQFVAAGTERPTLALVVLGALFIVQSTVFLLAVVAMVLPLRRWQAPAWLGRGAQGLCAALIAALALRLMLSPSGR